MTGAEASITVMYMRRVTMIMITEILKIVMVVRTEIHF